MTTTLDRISAAEGDRTYLRYHTGNRERVTVEFVLNGEDRFGGRVESLDDGSRYDILVDTSDWFFRTTEPRIPLYREEVLDESVERTGLPASPEREPSQWIVEAHRAEGSAPDTSLND